MPARTSHRASAKASVNGRNDVPDKPLSPAAISHKLLFGPSGPLGLFNPVGIAAVEPRESFFVKLFPPPPLLRIAGFVVEGFLFELVDPGEFDIEGGLSFLERCKPVLRSPDAPDEIVDDPLICFRFLVAGCGCRAVWREFFSVAEVLDDFIARFGFEGGFVCEAE